MANKFQEIYGQFRDRVVGELRKKFGEKVQAFGDNTGYSIQVAPEVLVEVCTELRDNPDFAFDYLTNLTAVDYPENFTVVYHLASIAKKPRRLNLKVQLTKDNPRISTVTTVWNAANVQERECFDLLGVIFEGHPKLERILLPEDFVGHPLRKDFKMKADN